MVIVLVLAKDGKASQPSLLVLLSCFMGHLLHNILWHLLCFLVRYPKVPETWPLWCTHSYMQLRSFLKHWLKNAWAFPGRNISKTLIWASSCLWDSKQQWSRVGLHLTRDGIALFTCIPTMILKRKLSLRGWEASKGASWRLFLIDEVEFSQLRLFVLSLWDTSLWWGPNPIFGEVLTPFPSLYIHPLPFQNGWSMPICTLMLRLCLYAIHLNWRRSTWRG